MTPPSNTFGIAPSPAAIERAKRDAADAAAVRAADRAAAAATFAARKPRSGSRSRRLPDGIAHASRLAREAGTTVAALPAAAEAWTAAGGTIADGIATWTDPKPATTWRTWRKSPAAVGLTTGTLDMSRVPASASLRERTPRSASPFESAGIRSALATAARLAWPDAVVGADVAVDLSAAASDAIHSGKVCRVRLTANDRRDAAHTVRVIVTPDGGTAADRALPLMGVIAGGTERRRFADALRKGSVLARLV